MAGITVSNQLLDKIQSFFNESGYNEMTKNTAKYNMTIRKDRIYRRPYIDSQTGIAQKHCHLFVSDKQRMPGILQGQVYTYPARRWKSTHRSYLTTYLQAPKAEPEEHTITTVENPAVLAGNVPVVNAQEELLAAEKSKEQWTFYEENTYDEEIEDDFESEEDYEDETYRRSKRRKTPGRKPREPKPGKPRKRSSLKAPSRLIRSIKKDETVTDDKPYVCELCSMRYKTRPGLTYHYAHSHREDDGEDKNKQQSQVAGSGGPGSGGSMSMGSNMSGGMKPIHHMVAVDQVNPQDQMMMPNNNQPPMAPAPMWSDTNGIAARSRRSNGNSPMIPSTVPGAHTPGGPHNNQDGGNSSSGGPMDPNKKRVAPSPYCDFCLGDSTENRKTGQSEQLVSCADCGRSGHPSCLQFTDNMMKSVLRYRWQCIECKTCTLCGTSENDDQLLFCDDCDRGYHLYCLNPPLTEPPEGEWSCNLCIKEFHNK